MRAILQVGLCAPLIFCLSRLGWSQDPSTAHEVVNKATVTPVVRRFEERYRNAKHLEATFLERYTENGHLTRMEAGKVYFERPGRMRWEYESPEKNVFLVDGKTAWFYVPADHTVTRVPAKRSSDWRTPLALLAGEMKLSRICSKIAYVETPSPEFSGDAVLYCQLRGASKPEEGGKPGGKPAALDEGGDAAFLEVAQSSGELVRVLVSDSGGVGIEFRFANWQLDPKLNDSIFRFQIPPGVAIVDGELAAAQKTASP